MKRLIAITLLLWVSVGWAAIDTYEFSTDAERARYRVLVEELRCPKCQNQNIADSNAPIAMDLRQEIYRLIQEGQTDEQIIEYLVARYGDFVRYNPPLSFNTLLLWFGPLFLLLGGVVGVRWMVRQRQQKTDTSALPLTDAEHQRLASLLERKKHD
ncbi:cytochrome c-type biogenesis protein CcmH [Azomonas agilis]|uniref:Cytochrome c-type biogenesis protein n=1 Tax=Azomonas agilis TaxID=116849 RepID=A0A562I1P3_9GAMM|nr:cytochrome c-type biogenesis protein [Azomonas agilis]TWH64920.1 cytochrome c-type biogenesis protein CcmH [Azomonas agilis]